MQVLAYPYLTAQVEKRCIGKTVIVIDLLRATTCILQALLNGADQVIPVRDVEEARMLSSNLGRDSCILAGERGGIKIKGYDIGNSPAEFKKEIVKDRTVVMCTSNGTNAILGCSSAKLLLMGCLRNRIAVAEEALASGNDIFLLCAGTGGDISADDIICAGALLHAMFEKRRDIELNDFALVCSMIYSAWKNGAADINAIQHYRHLKELGFQEDLDFCFTEDVSTAVPYYEHGKIKFIQN